MFVGHLAVAFASKRVSPSTSLAWFVAAATTLDLLWPFLLLAGIEQVRIVPGATAFNPLVFDSYPWSHSLLMALVWGVGLAALARGRGIEPGGAALIGALVVSHWALDFITHAPDMPLWPGSSPRYGLGLWNSIPGTFVVEGLMWGIALVLYLRGQRARSWAGAAAFWSLVGVCTVMWALGPWAPPPPSARGLAWFALIGWIILPWSVWIERSHRAAAGAVAPLRDAARLAIAAGALGSVGLTMRAGRGAAGFLLALFVLWVLSPFVLLGWAHIASKRWSAPTRTALDSVALVIMLGSLVAYGTVVLPPSGSPRAPVFVAVPPLSWMLMAAVVSVAALVSRRPSPRRTEARADP